MILYVNGDSHAAGAEAVNSFAFANDDPEYSYLGRLPHPDNIIVSYGKLLADNLKADFYCDAESASSNNRILRTTRKYLKENQPDLIVIGWSTWEREEVLVDGTYYQFSVGCKGIDWPSNVWDLYQQWLKGLDHKRAEQQAHDRIWQLHNELTIPHLFFNTLHPFTTNHYDWGNSYIDPYNKDSTYYHRLLTQGFIPNNYHFDSNAHKFWANHLTKHINEYIITT